MTHNTYDNQDNILRGLEQIVRLILGWSSVTLEIFIRTDFGSRYLTMGRLIMGWVSMQVFFFFYEGSFTGMKGTTSPHQFLLIIYILAYIGFGVFHSYRIHQRTILNRPWYARSFGSSRLSRLMSIPAFRIGSLRIAIDEWALYRFVEPALCFLLVALIFPYSATRAWLIWAACAMALHNAMLYSSLRQPVTDSEDAAIEQEAHETGQNIKGYMAIPQNRQPARDSLETGIPEETHETTDTA